MKTLIKNILKFAFAAVFLFGGVSFAAAGNFDTEFPGSGTGFLSVTPNDATNSCSGCANQNNSISINAQNPGDTDVFSVYFYFRNDGTGNITNARAKLSRSGGTFSGTLSGNGASTIGDNAFITNLPQDYDINFMSARIENTQGTDDPQYCSGYNRNDPVTESQLFGSGANLGTLDDLYNGICDQGYVVAVFELENTETIITPDDPEVDTNPADFIDENSATLFGDVEEGSDVNVWFRYSTSQNVSCSNGTFVNGPNSLDAGDDFDRTITGLNDDTTYYFIACGEDNNGNDAEGIVRQFTTDGDVIITPDDPEVDTNPADFIDENSATLFGDVEEGSDVNVWFRYSTSQNVSCSNGTFVNGPNSLDAGDDFDRTITGLNDDTTYYFIACGEDNNGNDAEGIVRQFTTDEENTGGGTLDVDTENASNLFQVATPGLGSATLNGEVQSGASQLAYFVYSSNGTPSCFDTSADRINAENFDTPYGPGDDFQATSLFAIETDYTYRACISANQQIAQGDPVGFRIDENGNGGGDDDFFIQTREEQDVEQNSAELRGTVDTTESDVNNIDLFFAWGEDLSEVEDVEDEDRFDDIDEDGDRLQVRLVEEDFDGDENFERVVNGLNTDERIYYQFCAEYEDSDGDYAIKCGGVEEFTTRSNNGGGNNSNPDVATTSARNINRTSAQMCGTIQDTNNSIPSWIEFRRADQSNFNRTTVRQRGEVTFCEEVFNLTPNTRYRYRACVEADSGVRCDVEASFTTLGDTNPQGTRPFIFTRTPTNIRSNSATLNSQYVANAATATCRFNYGRTQALGRQTRSYTVNGIGQCPHNFTNLASNTQYCVQAVINTVNGSDQGNITCFTTPRAVVTGGPTPVPTPPPVIVVEDEDEDLDLGLGLSLIRLDIDNDEEIVTRGEQVEYVIEWENISELDLRDLELEVTIPEEIQITDISRGRLDQDSNRVFFTIDDLEGADYDENERGEDGRMTVTGLVGRGTIGNLLTADAEIVYDNPVNDAQENARDFDLDEYGALVAGQTASVFGLTNITFLGWLVILLGLFIIFLVARWLYLEREELRAQAYLTGGYGSHGYGAPQQPRMPIYRDPAPRYEVPPAAPQMPPAQAPRDDYYEPYRPNRG